MRRITAILLALTFVFNIFYFTACTVGNSGGKNPGGGNVNLETDVDKMLLGKYSDFEIPREKLESALDDVIQKIDYMILTLGDKFPNECSTNNVYAPKDNNDGRNTWTTGFWTGILWHAYELTGDAKYMTLAESHVPGFLQRIEEKNGVNHHDMGFLYIPSCVASYKLVGNQMGREAALKAADHLITRYHESAEFIQAWGSVGADDNYRLIVDCLLNIPLLYWASEATGDSKYHDIAYKHFNTTVNVCYREDGSTYHTYYFDKVTGMPLRGATAQGASDDSTWSRGQAWGMYGPMLTYIYIKDQKALDTFTLAANYFLTYLPEDYVAFWDLSFTDGDDEPRDSSSAAIAVCAMLEAIKHMDESDPQRRLYVNACNKIMNSLIDNYMTTGNATANGLLLHGTYSKPAGNGVDEMTMWGDYFFMEALHRMLDPSWNLYW